MCIRDSTGSWKVKGPSGSVSLKANKIGSECFRLWKACEAQVGDDFHINPEEIEAKYFGVLTKLFNVARFASQFDNPADLDVVPEDLSVEDRWILAEFSNTMEKVENGWTQLDIYTATQALKTFGTGILPSHWLEMSKSRLYDGDSNAAEPGISSECTSCREGSSLASTAVTSKCEPAGTSPRMKVVIVIFLQWPHGSMVPFHGPMASWSHGPMVPWSHGPMVPWSHGAMVPWYHFTILHKLEGKKV